MIFYIAKFTVSDAVLSDIFDEVKYMLSYFAPQAYIPRRLVMPCRNCNTVNTYSKLIWELTVLKCNDAFSKHCGF